MAKPSSGRVYTRSRQGTYFLTKQFIFSRLGWFEFRRQLGQITARDDGNTARSRYGFIITYAGWALKMQQEIALSSTEVEFIGLSYALRTTIPIMELLKEFHKNGHRMQRFEDNSGAIEIAGRNT
jgi:hypothetical protein